MSQDEERKGFDRDRSERNLTFLLWGVGGLFIAFLVIVLFIGRGT